MVSIIPYNLDRRGLFLRKSVVIDNLSNLEIAPCYFICNVDRLDSNFVKVYTNNTLKKSIYTDSLKSGLLAMSSISGTDVFLQYENFFLVAE